MGLTSMLFPSCKELAQRLSKGGYERASWPERLAVRWHLLRCELCERYARQLGLIADAYRKGLAGRARDDGSLEQRLVEKLRKTK